MRKSLAMRAQALSEKRLGSPTRCAKNWRPASNVNISSNVLRAAAVNSSNKSFRKFLPFRLLQATSDKNVCFAFFAPSREHTRRMKKPPAKMRVWAGGLLCFWANRLTASGFSPEH
jgi:alpha-beta hydrolase superfamily lysophospholipase